LKFVGLGLLENLLVNESLKNWEVGATGATEIGAGDNEGKVN
jgi:hypothetical protein